MKRRIRTLVLLFAAAFCLLLGAGTVRAADLDIQGSKSMTLGSEQTLALVNIPTDLPEDEEFQWTTSDSSILTVSAAGETCTVRAVGTGTATVTAGFTADSSTTFSVSFAVTVENLPVPTMKSAEPTGADSIKITWTPVSGAEGYRIYRKSGTGSYKKVTDVAGSSKKSYTDTGRSLGTTYTYTVRAYYGSRLSASQDGLSASTSDFQPVMKSAAVVSSTSIQVKWNSVSGAESYQLWRKTGDGKWKNIKSTTKTSYKDTGLACGTTYSYAVKAVVGSKTTSRDPNGISLQAAPVAPTLTGLSTRGKTSLVLQWESVEGADGYRVYRKNDAGRWVTVKKYTSALSYTDETVTYGTDYTYTVKAYTKVDGKRVWSARSEDGITGHTLSSKKVKSGIAVPKLTSAKGTSYRRVTVSWEPVSGVDGYMVYRKTSGGSWKRIRTLSGETTAEYTDKSCTFGTTYTYSVCAYVSYDGTKLKGSKDETGVKGKPVLAAPALKSTKVSGITKITVKWGTVTGASGYRVSRKEKGGKWKALKTFSGKATSYTDSSAKADTTYYYTVRAYRTVNGKKVWGSYDKDGISGTTKVTSKYKNGLKLYYDGSGKLITDVESIIGKQDSYYIKVNKSKNVVTVYAKDANGDYVVPVKSFVCSTGAATPIGTFTTPAKYRWKELMGPCWGQWCTRIHGGVLFHSVFYNSYNNNMTLSVSAYNKLGTQCSHGCVRLKAGDAKWIYDNCALGTKVTIYSSSDPGPFGKPSSYKLSSSHTWDPTDPTAYYKCKKNGCH